MAVDSYQFAQLDGPAYSAGGPLIFAFHGTGGNEGQFLEVAAQMAPEARVIAPRGDVSEGAALRFFKRAAEGVYDMADLAQRTQAMARFIEAHREVAKPSAVFGLGYSNGANIMAAVADHTPGLFTHMVMMHPLVTWGMADGHDMKSANVLITAGGRDPICPPDMTGKLADMLEARGAAVKTWWHAGGHEISREEMQAAFAWFAAQRAALEGSATLMIEHEDDGKKGRYFMVSQAGVTAEMTYTWGRPGCMIIDHTDVPDVFRGQKVGLRLLERLINDARAAGNVIVPLCPFAAAQFKRHPEWVDVLDTTVQVKTKT